MITAELSQMSALLFIDWLEMCRGIHFGFHSIVWQPNIYGFATINAAYIRSAFICAAVGGL